MAAPCLSLRASSVDLLRTRTAVDCLASFPLAVSVRHAAKHAVAGL